MRERLIYIQYAEKKIVVEAFEVPLFLYFLPPQDPHLHAREHGPCSSVPRSVSIHLSEAYFLFADDRQSLGILFGLSPQHNGPPSITIESQFWVAVEYILFNLFQHDAEEAEWVLSSCPIGTQCAALGNYSCSHVVQECSTLKYWALQYCRVFL